MRSVLACSIAKIVNVGLLEDADDCVGLKHAIVRDARVFCDITTIESREIKSIRKHSSVNSHFQY